MSHRNTLLAALARKPANYAEAKRHSAELDALLGIDTQAAERRARKAWVASDVPVELRQEHWLDLPVESLLTPYSELAELVRKLPKACSWVDLGAAYGRLGLVLAVLNPEATFVGFEVVPERVSEGRLAFERLGLDPECLRLSDCSRPEFKPPEADVYFIYDYGSQAAVEKTLEDLREIAASQAITVVARGRGARSWIERGQPWLCDVVPPEHGENSSIYRSAYNAT